MWRGGGLQVLQHQFGAAEEIPNTWQGFCCVPSQGSIPGVNSGVVRLGLSPDLQVLGSVFALLRSALSVYDPRLLGQVAQTVLDLKLWENLSSPLTFNYVSISPVSWLLGFLSLILVVIINEIVKLHEIRYGGGGEDGDKGWEPHCSLALSCREIMHREQGGE